MLCFMINYLLKQMGSNYELHLMKTRFAFLKTYNNYVMRKANPVYSCEQQQCAGNLLHM